MREASSFVRLKIVLCAGMVLSGCGGGEEDGASGGGVSDAAATYYSWMNAEIQAAWDQGFLGQLTRVAVLDDFTSGSAFTGDLGEGPQLQGHGDWVKQQITYLAPQATVDSFDFNLNARVPLVDGLNILNLSYGAYAGEGLNIQWDRLERSVIDYATQGDAVVVKAAGNDSGTAVGAANSAGQVDYLARSLIGTQSAIFVGALSSNGSTDEPASIASYSNIAGSNTLVQNHFLVVGVEGDETGLYGTSFAAPVVSGYAAILGSKFTTATPTQITNQLLSTARRDTIRGYNVTIHGQGEASIANALAPMSIN